jgi:Tol biopolymer transport system component
VVFNSLSDNLVESDTNGILDIFVHDRVTGETTLESVSSDGTQENNAAHFSSISADGRYVLFESEATNLVEGDTNEGADCFVHDRGTGKTTLVPVSSDGIQENENSGDCSISADGRHVAFSTWSTNLVMGDTNGTIDVFVRDLGTGK